ncbi:tetratricopeptide repeat protein [Hyalangium versicolor]|uniref:tetratricopeptide repeat protein n=1 Tax=Hyalangium versicolor TaxID=2861190 RepID=UPI001CCA692B|nr:tetratricopeptide repeat protein [Hyalangium versicolor]
MKASSLSCALMMLLPWWAEAQPPPRSAPPVPLSAAAREAMQLAEQGCQSDGYDEDLCERAISRLEASVRENPAQLEVRLALAQACWNRAFQERPESRSRQNWQRRSMDIFQELADRKVADARPYYELSVRQKDDARRMALLQRTVELNPRHARANQDLAWGLLRQGKTDEASQVYQRHLQVSPVRDRQEARENLRFAGALAQAQRPRQAAQVLETVMDQMQGERRAERCLLLQSADPRLAKARPNVRRALQELRPYCTDMEHLDRAVDLEQQGRVDEAVTELEQQMAANPKPEETYVMLERLYLRKGQPEKAAEVTTHYLRSEPDAREKCERFQRLSPLTLRAMDTSTLEATRRQCGQR